MKKHIKFLIFVGISGSGKSTYAKNELERNPETTTIINRDSIRNMLFGYTDKTAYLHYELPTKEFNRREKIVSNIANLMIKDAILGKNPIDTIIIDNTNLKLKYLKEYEYYNIPMEFKFFDVDLETAIERDSKRERQVGESVIKRQYSQYKNIVKQLVDYEFSPKSPKEYDSNKQDVIIVDIDGTLAHKGDRDIFDYKKVMVDTLDELVADLSVNSMYDTIICSGRSMESYKDTRKWLKQNGIFFRDLYMRKSGDYRKDWKVKEEFWDEISKEYNIVGMIDDRSQVVDRARYLGYKVLQVDYGNF